MKMILASLSASLMFGAVAFAESALVPGGSSADGKCEVLITRKADYDPNKDGSEYFYSVQAKGAQKPMLTIEGSGYGVFSAVKYTCKALWDESGRFVVIRVLSGRHISTIHLVAVTSDGAKILELPDYVQNALGRVDATWVDFACGSDPIQWDGNDLLVGLSFTARGRHSYNCMVTLQVTSNANQATPSVGLKSVTKPMESEG
ncbi:MAG: hypothetical protein ABIT37_13275 [Luteolibacter sp.]